MTQTNAIRRDYYTYYTGKTWGDARNYHAVFDTSKLPASAIVSAVKALYQ